MQEAHWSSLERCCAILLLQHLVHPVGTRLPASVHHQLPFPFQAPALRMGAPTTSSDATRNITLGCIGEPPLLRRAATLPPPPPHPPTSHTLPPPPFPIPAQLRAPCCWWCLWPGRCDAACAAAAPAGARPIPRLPSGDACLLPPPCSTKRQPPTRNSSECGWTGCHL